MLPAGGTFPWGGEDIGCPLNIKGDAISTESSAKTPLKVDYFLYSCFEFEQTCKAFPQKARSDERWPEVIKRLETPEGETPEAVSNIEEALEQSLSWYVQQFPEVQSESKIEFDNIGSLSQAAVFFSQDMKVLLHEQPEQLDSLANESSPLWPVIDRIVRKHVPHLSDYFIAYLRWSHIKIEEKKWALGERPPVGRYTPGGIRNAGRPGGNFGGGPRRSGPPGRSGDRDRGPRRDAGDRDRAPRSGGDRDRERGRDKGERGGKDRSERSRGRERPQRGPRDDSRGGGSHADQEAAAIETVKVALEKLRADTSLAEVRLDPSNSFFRRLQHKKAVADGFYSYSTGEGAGRSVVITRERPANEDAE